MDGNQRFLNKHVLITGGARGIGFEIARQFAREGAILSVFDFNKENLDKASLELNGLAKKVLAYEVNVADQDVVRKAVADAEAKQPIDILINNAGIAFETPFLNIEAREWKNILDINLTGMF